MSDDHDPPLVVLTGPTAVGKSQLAVDLAVRLGGPIVSADSRQVYRDMEIGTAAPTSEQRRLVPHFLVGHVDPDEPYHVARFQREAAEVLDAADASTPVWLVGGSYHYIQALVERLRFPGVAPDSAIRGKLEAEAAEIGAPALHRRLAERDPQAAAQILPGNLRRIMRALEVIEVTGELFSAQSRRRGPPRPALRLALTCDRTELYRRIDGRVDDMLAEGWLAEVRRLADRDIGPEVPSMGASGYRELAAHLRGEISLEEAAQRTRYSTHAFARRQYAWFRRDPELNWIERGPDMQRTAETLVQEYLARRTGEA